MIKNLKNRGVHKTLRFIITLLSVKYGTLKIHSILFTLWESRWCPISGACVHKRMPKLAVGGCCEAAANGIRPWTPWIWGILDFRSIRVYLLRSACLLNDIFRSLTGYNARGWPNKRRASINPSIYSGFTTLRLRSGLPASFRLRLIAMAGQAGQVA